MRPNCHLGASSSLSLACGKMAVVRIAFQVRFPDLCVCVCVCVDVCVCVCRYVCVYIYIYIYM